MMKLGAIFFAVLILSASCQPKYPTPVVEDCIIGDNGLICIDERISKDIYDLSFEDAVNYRATSPEDFALLKNHEEFLRAELIKCQDKRD